MLLLGIDIGTSACKTAVFTKDGTVVCEASEEYKVYYPKEGYAEQNPLEWYDAICNCIKKICMKVNAEDIQAIGIDGQSWSCIPIDHNGNVLFNTPIWFDTRASFECDYLKKTIGEDEIYNVCKNPIEPMYTTPKVLWFKNNKPEIYKDTACFLQSNSYIAYRLTGELLQDKSMGYGHFFYNMEKGEYDGDLAEKMEIDLSRFPKIADCHKIVGEITKKASIETGLKIGTPVVIGGVDAACGTLGAGVYKAGQTQEQGGQAGGMSICQDGPIGDKRLILGNHVIPGLWLLQGGTVGGGSAIKWFSEQFGDSFLKSEGNIFQAIDREAEEIPPASEGTIFLPYMNGERSPIWDVNAKGVYYGLSFSKTRAHLARATMEGVAFALRHNLDVAYSAGAKIDRLYTMGGSANSKLWTQIKSDVTKLPIVAMNSDNASTLGAVILAGIGTGIYKSYEEAVEMTLSVKREHQPVYYPEYDRAYEKYLKIYKCLKGVMQE